jgi:peptidyl-prolyl cis-trans isomerase D
MEQHDFTYCRFEDPMINFFRRAMNSWVTLAFLTLILAAFVITGFTSWKGGQQGGALAKVGSTEISEAELKDQIKRQLDRIQQEQPTVTASVFAKGGGLEAVFRFLIQRASVMETLGDLGIVSGREQLKETINGYSEFKIGNEFSKTKYEQTLATNRLTPAKFEAAMGEDLAREQLVAGMARNLTLPKSALLAYASLIEELRTASVVLVPASQMPRMEIPGDTVLMDFYTKNKAGYMAPETRSFRYFTVDQSSVAATVKISDDDLRKAYDANKAEYGGVELRRIQQLLVDNEATAKTVSIATTEAAFLAAAQKAVPGLTVEDLALGDLAQTDMAKDSGKDAAKIVFGLKAGQTSQPVTTDRGWMVYRVASITPPKASSFESVRPALTEKVRADKALVAINEVWKDLEDAAGASKSLADMAKIAGATIIEVKNIANVQKNPDGTPITAAPPEIMKLAFDHAADDDLIIDQLGETKYAVVDTISVQASKPRPFADVRNRLGNDWLRVNLITAARKKADEIAVAIKAGQSLAAAGKAAGFTVRENLTGSRLAIIQAGRPVGPFEQKIFSLRQGEVGVAVAPGGEVFTVIQVSKITPVPVSDKSLSYAMWQQQSNQFAGLEAMHQFFAASREFYKASYNQKAMTKAKNTIVGTAPAE